MEIEHINDDTIRVRIENSDLEARGYTFLDLLGNQKQIETFFYSILEEVDIDEEFQESDAVTFQVMPSRNGLELFISKNTDVHENFLTNVDFEDYTNQNADVTKDYSRFEKPRNSKKKKEEGTESEISQNEKQDHHIVVEFQYFEQLIQLAGIFQTESGFTSLYQFNGKYYLELNFMNDEFSLRTPQEETALVMEFAEKTSISADVLSEHGKLLIQDVALETINHYFN
jgi:adapter protein MecA 1/2